MVVGAGNQHRIVRCRLIKVIAGRMPVFRHTAVVISPTLNPLARGGRRCLLGNRRLERRYGRGLLGCAVDGAQVIAKVNQVAVSFNEAGRHGLSAEVDDFGVRSRHFSDFGIAADADNLIPQYRHSACLRLVRVHRDDVSVFINSIRKKHRVPLPNLFFVLSIPQREEPFNGCARSLSDIF
ncbi:hypothetical protein SDC9_137428 [bioreactor metagenome]|uniref:Uncharacterized protein n=1 Tax=bioreactor metagenome TaxID=1076179 RepID=A0A645DM00_9ZZZZ